MMQESDLPLVTFALISYRQSEFICESVQSVLAQDYPNLEIILSDDCSPDNTYQLIEMLGANYRGPHHLVLNSNSQNLGLARHVNRVCELASGLIVVIGAGDDIFSPDRVSHIVSAFKQNSDVYSVYSNAFYIDEVGEQLPGSLGQYRKILPGTPKNVFEGRAHAYGCVHAWKKESYSTFGPLHPDVVYEDQAISMRSALLGEIAYIDMPLVKYRMHSSNLALGRNRRTREQFETVYRRKIFETQQFIRDLTFFCETPQQTSSVTQKTKDAKKLLLRAEARLAMLQKVDSLKQGNSITVWLPLMLQLWESLFRDRSVFLMLLQKIFPISISVKNWLQYLFR
ncbi:glycosyltransferase [Limnobacter sp.]|uniref:glycosyltransferase n=1 Tax=Limnobacter sp. TaxID=2003368 RepID=UPI0027BABFCE|nr:glycosyltransferase [Limnobacter sp.]